MKIFFLTSVLLFLCTFAFSQGVGINTDSSDPDAKALLDVKGTGLGLLIPRMLWADKPTALTNTDAHKGLLIYSTDGDGTNGAGFYYWNGTDWVKFGAALLTAGTGISISGNTINSVWQKSGSTLYPATANDFVELTSTNAAGAIIGKYNTTTFGILGISGKGLEARSSTSGNNANISGSFLAANATNQNLAIDATVFGNSGSNYAGRFINTSTTGGVEHYGVKALIDGNTTNAYLYALHGSVTGTADYSYGLFADATGGTINYGAFSRAYGGTTNYGNYSVAQGASGSNYAGYFLNSSTTAGGTQYSLFSTANGSGGNYNYGISASASAASLSNNGGYFSADAGATAAQAYGIIGDATGSTVNNIGVVGTVSGESLGAGKAGSFQNSIESSTSDQIVLEALMDGGGNTGTSYGLKIRTPAASGDSIFGIFSEVNHTSSDHWAGWFKGKTAISNGSSLYLYDSDNTNNIQIKTPVTGSLTSNYTLTLPGTAGTSDYVLKTDGSGNLSWADPSTFGSSFWSRSGTKLYPTTANDYVEVVSANGVTGAVFAKYNANRYAKLAMQYVAVQGIFADSDAQNETFGGHFQNNNASQTNNTIKYGVYSEVLGNVGSSTGRIKKAGHFYATGTALENYGIYAEANGATTNWAGYFVGNTAIRSGNSLYLYDSDNTNNIKIKTPVTGNLTSDYTLVLPTTAGTANYILKTDGFGNLSWTPGGWTTEGNSGLDAATNFIGTTDNVDVVFKRNNEKSGLLGSSNTAYGYFALSSGSLSGSQNTALGVYAVQSNTTGVSNVGIGFGSLYNNQTGDANVALGTYALGTASGTAISYNVAVGHYAMAGNSGNYNSALGGSALYNNSGSSNAAVGHQALEYNTSGSQNTAIGILAGRNISVYLTGSNNTFVGYNTTYSSGAITNSTALGNGVSLANSNYVHIGNTSVSWIGGQVTWSTYSDARIKENITNDVKGLDFILKLQPVTYTENIDIANKMRGIKDETDYSEKYDIEKIRFSGFLAQEVEKAAKECGYNFSGVVAPKSDKDLYSLRYAEFTVPLVKAVQEQQALILKQQAIIETVLKQNELLNAEIEKIKSILNTEAKK